LNLGNFCICAVERAHGCQHFSCLFNATLIDQPARGLWDSEHAEEQTDCWNGCDSQHVAPHAFVLTPDIADDGVNDECCQLANDNQELVTAGEGATNFKWGKLCEVDGNNGGSA